MKRSAQPLPSGAATNDGLERDAEEAQLALEVVAHVLAAVVVAQRKPRGDARPVAAEVFPQPLAQRLQRFEARAGARRVDADALLCAVVDGDEDGSVALAGGEAGSRVGPPHFVGVPGGDRAVVVARPAAAPDRVGASRPASRISRSTRPLDVRTPARRSRAQALR